MQKTPFYFAEIGVAGKLKKPARFLFHTGITRAKKVLVMVGTKKAQHMFKIEDICGKVRGRYVLVFMLAARRIQALGQLSLICR